jgi:crotonobetainyl-CoA:carnitine CoA-transferase CaiB-like acyl-CoA transferase
VSTADNRAPLEGIRVFDLTQVVAGPFCTTMLADMGAEVVKIERPKTGDDLRHVGRYEGRDAHEDYFNASNRTKKSVVLDLKRPRHQAVAQAMASRADILVENFAPGTAERLGLGWSTLHAMNPRLVYCSLSGFGQDGPFAHRLALDPIIQAVSGVMSVTGQPDGPPTMVGAPLADVISGLYAAYAVLGTLMATQRDGLGRRIDLSMQAAMMAALGPRMGQALQAGQTPKRIGNQNLMRVPSNVFTTGDGVHLSVMVTNDRHWPPFCRALGRTEWLDDPRFQGMRKRATHRDAINALVGARFAELTAAELSQRLEKEKVPFARVNDYLEALKHPQVAHRKIVREIDHPTSGRIRIVGPPWSISDLPTPMASPPILGQHTADVLSDWLSMTPSDIASIVAEGTEEDGA